MRGGPELKVLDSWIIMGWLKDQKPACDVMERLWEQARQRKLRLVASIINLGEIYYLTAKARNIETAESVVEQLQKMPLEIQPASDSMVFRAARLKGRFPISYADAFAAATAVMAKAPLVTGDPKMRKL